MWLIIVVSVVDLFELVGLVIRIRFCGWLISLWKIGGYVRFFSVSIFEGMVWNIVLVFWFWLNVLIWKCVSDGILNEKLILRNFLKLWCCLFDMMLYISVCICLWFRVGMLM